MESIAKRVELLKQDLAKQLQEASTDEKLENIRVAFLGRNGHIAAIMGELKQSSLEEKKILGPLLNDLKNYAETTIKNKKEELANLLLKREELKTQHFDVTISKKRDLQGKLHLYTIIFNRIEDIFTSMGYAVADGPEVEQEYYNFDALNIPSNHPARDMFDTIWISDVPNTLLRTHTSPIQVRTMESQGVPLAVVAPGRCYRFDAVDATHDFMFTQVEALVIGKNINISHLLATAQTFGQAFFEKKDLNIRVRPSYFPFVEPGLEVDFTCPFCSGGCSICKKTGWIEIGGAGLVHPHVLRCGGIDPEKYSGFAFGFGIERLAMLKYRIPDIRLFHSAKLCVLKQF